ncbi:MAG: site-specific integrase [Gammaproteobacteria bacterium]|nr:site-specific integrase [Gammaproteobacteria bacterium]
MGFHQRSKQELNSSAHLSHIDVFYPSQCALTEHNAKTTARFTPFRYTDTALQLSLVEDGVIRQFPIIIRGDGTFWDLGNLYLMHRFTELAKIEPPSIETIQGIAKHLMMYLRWIEHVRAQDAVIHELYFPDREELRVTYSYHRYLRRLLRENPQPISLGVAKARMQAVIGFYRGILHGGLVRESAISNAPYEAKAIGIPVVNSVGLQYIKQIETSNLTIKAPRRETVLGTIKDGGNLRPLTEEEQNIVHAELDRYGNRAFQLMCFVALFTGARIQTVCTLRIKHLKDILKSKPIGGEFLLKVGPGTDIDTKNNVNYRLHFPLKVASIVYEYIASEEHAQRRAKSFYGGSDENYVFLSRSGSPYFTSKREIKDRQEGSFSQRISPKDRVTFTIQKGYAVRNYIQRLTRDIRCKNPDFNHFRFHDLRATFGMNFVRDADKAGNRDVREYLRSRMGHKNFQTTQLYLNYDETNEAVQSVTVYHHDRLNRLA